MRTGMLWFDDSSRPMTEKVERAVVFYRDKFGRQPDLCLVNPDSCDMKQGVIAGVELRQARMVLPDHLWVGVDEEAAAAREKSTRQSGPGRKPARRRKMERQEGLRLPLFVDEQAA
jgi:hypothetical protein